jgi:hypothetical protein
MKNEFNFAIARKWNEHSDRLCVYTIFSHDVDFGTMTEAENIKKYVEEKTGEKYKIYKLVEVE